TSYVHHRPCARFGAFDGAGDGVGNPVGAEPAPTRGDVTLYKNPQLQEPAMRLLRGIRHYLRHNGFKVKAISTNDLTIMGRAPQIEPALSGIALPEAIVALPLASM